MVAAGSVVRRVAAGGVVLWAAARAMGSSPARVARMGGSSIAGPTAAGWVTDFLNAAYYQRPAGLRRVDDLRFAWAVLTTRWHELGHRRLVGPDVAAFHRAFGRDRFLDRTRTPRGTLDRGQLEDGARRLLGDWVVEAYADPARRGWGIAFRTEADKAAYHPEQRLRHAVLGRLTPPVAPGREQTWHSYPAVSVASADAVVSALSTVATWPDYASEIGRFTPLRSTGLEGQTFEVEVLGQPTNRIPLMLRGYVTVTRVVTAADPDGLRAYADEVSDGMARFGRDEQPPLPAGATPLFALDLTTHEGHFMGHARNRLLLYRDDGGRDFLVAAGTWDPMEWHLQQMYDRAGREAQQAFWGMGTPDESMLHQIAEAVAGERPGSPA